MRRVIAVAVGIVVVAAGAAFIPGLLVGSDVDCMEPRYLGEMTFGEGGAAPDGAVAARAQEVAVAHSSVDDAKVAELLATTVASGVPGMEEGAPAIVALIRDTAGPRPLVGTPANLEGPFVVDSPCEFVVMDASGNFLFTHRTSFPVDRGS